MSKYLQPYVVSRNILYVLCLCLLVPQVFFATVCFPGPGSPGERPAPEVTVRTLARENVVFEQSFTGYVEGERTVEVRAQVSGVLTARRYEEGAFVKEGQVLFEIEPARYQAAYDQAAARLETVRARFTNASRDQARAAPLAQRSAISPREFDTVQAEFNAAKAAQSEAEAALRAAKIQLDFTQVKAPISGYATMARMAEGSLVTAGSPTDSLLTSINYMDSVNVIFSVSDALVRRISGYISRDQAELLKNAEANLEVAKGDIYLHRGRVAYGNAVISRTTGSMMAKALFPNPEHELLSGQIVRISASLLTFPNALVVPQHAVLQGQGGALALVVKADDTVEFRPVTTLVGILPNAFLVTAGLEAGERIIIEGVGKVGPGMKVHPQEASGKSEVKK